MTDFDIDREARKLVTGLVSEWMFAEKWVTPASSRIATALRRAYEAGIISTFEERARDLEDAYSEGAKQMWERAIEYFSLRGHVKVPNDLAALPLTEEAKP